MESYIKAGGLVILKWSRILKAEVSDSERSRI